MILNNTAVILVMPSGNSKIITIRQGTEISLGKFGKFQCDRLIGKPFNCMYTLEGELYESTDYHTFEGEGNAFIVDDPSSQKLSQLQIEKMKMELTESDIISSLCKNNATFDQKTEFSKLKYIKRKQKKFQKVFCPLECNALNYCTFYFSKNPAKILNIRIDTLSQMLTLGNVRHGSRLLLVDDMSGLLTLACLERMGIRSKIGGELFIFHDKEQPSLEMIQNCNLDSEFLKESVYAVPWHKIKAEINMDNLAKCSTPESLQRATNRIKRLQYQQEALERGQFHGLLVASKYNSLEIVNTLYPYLAGSSPVVLYAPKVEMLLETFHEIRFSTRFINTNMTESWMREYQLPVQSSGTHPTMMTSGSGGFLVSAIATANAEVEIDKRRNHKI